MLWRTAILGLILAQGALAFSEPGIRGAWRPELYVLKDGTELRVTGLIFFTETDWTVLFFVMGGDSEPRRGSGEGGTYRVDGDALEFTHRFHLSGGETPLRMSIASETDAEKEPCRVELGEEEMTIFFPSGNRMRFKRSSY